LNVIEKNEPAIIARFCYGGIPEAVIQGFNGILAEQLTAFSFQVAVKKGIANLLFYNILEIAEDAATRFDIKKQAEKYLKIYEDN